MYTLINPTDIPADGPRHWYWGVDVDGFCQWYWTYNTVSPEGLHNFVSYEQGPRWIDAPRLHLRPLYFETRDVIDSLHTPPLWAAVALMLGDGIGLALSLGGSALAVIA